MACAQVTLTGVNLAGAEFGSSNLPGVYNQDYTYPTAAEVDYFLSKGLSTFRIPFRWERMQPTLEGGLDVQELNRLDTLVNYATSKGANVILDVHNYGAYQGSVIGAASSPVTNASFSDLWSRLAGHYASNEKVIFGLMNEPVGLDDASNPGGRPGGSTENWLLAANAAILSIRQAGAQNLVLVPGNGYTGAWSWGENFYGTPNTTVMKGVIDPGKNFAYEVHQYFDNDWRGDSNEVQSATVGSEALEGFTNWLRDQGARGFLGEFGVAGSPLALSAMDDMLGYIDANADVWLGWTYWAAGPWWGNYSFSVEPDQNGDRPQLAVLQSYAAPIPEPSTWGLLMVCGCALGIWGCWRKLRGGAVS